MSLFNVCVLAYVFIAGMMFNSMLEVEDDKRTPLARMSIGVIKLGGSSVWPLVAFITFMDSLGSYL